VAEAGPGGQLVELEFGRSLPGHHRVAAATPGGGKSGHINQELYTLQVGVGEAGERG
jgi:hypothetical protein